MSLRLPGRGAAAGTLLPPTPGRPAARRWAVAGALLASLLASIAFAPAAWLASALAEATGQRLLLAEARGTLWNGSAVAVLTGGPGSQDASALPGRLHWTLRPGGLGLDLFARQACCINGELRLHLQPGWGRWRVELPARDAASGTLGQWPARWLVGLGTPWNTLQLSGALRLTSPGLRVERVQGRWRFEGRAEVALDGVASRLSTLDTLGSYRLVLSAAPTSPAAPGAAGLPGDALTLELGTTEGALRLSGRGQVVGQRLRFDGQASAAPGSEAALNNLLNIIGRRQGALSVISIG